MTASVYWPTVPVDVLLIAMLIVSCGWLGFVMRSKSLRFCPGVPLWFHILATGRPGCRWAWIQGSVNVREVPGDASCSRLTARALMLSRYTKWKKNKTKHTSRAKKTKRSCRWSWMQHQIKREELVNVLRAPCLSSMTWFAQGRFLLGLCRQCFRFWTELTLGNPGTTVTKLVAEHPKTSPENTFTGVIKPSPEISH